MIHALVLSGGGARGAYEGGVVSALFETESFEIICGTSIGAINGALAAQGAIAAIQELWGTVSHSSLVRFVPRVSALRDALSSVLAFAHDPLLQRGADLAHIARAIGRIGGLEGIFKLEAFLDHLPIVDLLERHLRFDEIERTLIVTSTDLGAGIPSAFYAFREPAASEREAHFIASSIGSRPMSAANYAAAVRASSSIPLAFEPVMIEDDRGAMRAYVDGGVANNTPIRQAIDAGADEITIVLLDNPPLAEEHAHAGFAGVGTASFGVIKQRLLELDLKLARTINEAVRKGVAPGYREVSIRTISPSVPFSVPLLGFDRQEEIDAAFALGLADGRAAATSQTSLSSQ